MVAVSCGFKAEFRLQSIFKVRQFVFEWHFYEPGSDVDYYRRSLELIALLERHGFRCFHSRHNPLFDLLKHYSFDMSFVNTNLVAA